VPVVVRVAIGEGPTVLVAESESGGGFLRAHAMPCAAARREVVEVIHTTAFFGLHKFPGSHSESVPGPDAFSIFRLFFPIKKL
jgi:hypothetical protein